MSAVSCPLAPRKVLTNGALPSDPIADDSYSYLSEDCTYQQRIADSGRYLRIVDCCSVPLLEENIDHGHCIVLVAILEEWKGRGTEAGVSNGHGSHHRASFCHSQRSEQLHLQRR